MAGVPIAVDALGQLGRDPADPAGNVAGSAGAIGGGLGGGALGAILGAPLGPVGKLAGFGIGSWLGSQGGGALARNASTAVQGYFNDPIAKGIRDTERMYESQTGMMADRARQMMPVEEAMMRLNYEDQARRAALASRLQGQAAYQQSLLQGAMAPVGAYQDPNYMAMLGNISMQGLR